MYTLQHYYEEAQLQDIPPWADQITLHKPSSGEPLTPRWSQIEGLNMCFAYENQRAALFDDMGSGKTLVAQAMSIWHVYAGNLVLTLMPKNLLKQYEKSFLRTFKGVEHITKPFIYWGTPKQRDTWVDSWNDSGPPKMILTTYDMFRKEFVMFRKFGYNVIIMDEARGLGNVNNSFYTGLLNFMGVEGSKAALVMQGTPAGAQLASLYGYINFLTPGVYRNRGEFDAKHVTYQSVAINVRAVGGGTQKRDIDVIVGYRNHRELYKNLYRQARRVEKENVMDIPDVQVIPYEVDLDPGHLKAYKKLVSEHLMIFPDNTILDATTSAGLRKSSIEAVIHPSTLQLKCRSAILDGIDELFESINIAENKVLLMAHHRATIHLFREEFKKYNPAVIFGGTKDAETEKMRFINDPECRLMIINYVAGGIGVDGWQDVCSYAIGGEPTTVIGDLKQAYSRLHRSGQKNKVTVYMMSAVGTIFPKIIEKMEKNQGNIDAVVSRESLRRELLDLPDQKEEEVDTFVAF